MNHRQLGNSELSVSPICLGTMTFGVPVAEAEAIQLVHEAIDLGINWIDTAPVYGMGTAETTVGKALAGMDARPIIATKCGRTWRPDRTIEPRIKRGSIKRECEESLSRLGIDVIDLYQIHWPEPEADVEEAWDAVCELKAEGKIRWCGVSNFSVAHLERVHARRPVASLQPPYSMLRRDVEGGERGVWPQMY